MSQAAHSPVDLTRTVANRSLPAVREAVVRDATAHPRPAPGRARPWHAHDTRAALIILVFGLAAFTWIARLGDIRAGLVGLDAPPTGRAAGPIADRPGEPSPGVRASGSGRDDVHRPRAAGEDRTSSDRGGPRP